MVSAELDDLPTGKAPAIEPAVGIGLQVAGVDVDARDSGGPYAPGSKVNANLVGAWFDRGVFELPEIDQRQIVLPIEPRADPARPRRGRRERAQSAR